MSGRHFPVSFPWPIDIEVKYEISCLDLSRWRSLSDWIKWTRVAQLSNYPSANGFLMAWKRWKGMDLREFDPEYLCQAISEADLQSDYI